MGEEAKHLRRTDEVRSSCPQMESSKLPLHTEHLEMVPMEKKKSQGKSSISKIITLKKKTSKQKHKPS